MYTILRVNSYIYIYRAFDNRMVEQRDKAITARENAQRQLAAPGLSRFQQKHHARVADSVIETTEGIDHEDIKALEQVKGLLNLTVWDYR